MKFSIAVFCFLVFRPFVYGQLDYKFYDSTCPNLTKIVRFGVWSAMANDTRIAASLLRLHFYDCISNVINLKFCLVWFLENDF